MNDKDIYLEKMLRRALRSTDPSADFAARVMDSVSEQSLRFPEHVHPRRSRSPVLPIALAASVIATVGLGYWHYEQNQMRQGLHARAQVLQALQLTSENLNTARRMVIGETENQ